MDTNKNRQINIIDPFEAADLAQQGGKRKAAPKKNKNTTGPKPTGQQNGRSSRPRPAKKAPATSSSGPRYYEKDGLKIDLYDKTSKKRVQARLSQGLRNRSQQQLLDIVEEYAGAGKRELFKDASKADIADWIETVETRALPANPKSKLSLPEPEAEEEKEFEVDPNDPLWDDEPPVGSFKGKGKAPVHDKGMSGELPRNVMR
jgi:hypothetical protein